MVSVGDFYSKSLSICYKRLLVSESSKGGNEEKLARLIGVPPLCCMLECRFGHLVCTNSLSLEGFSSFYSSTENDPS